MKEYMKKFKEEVV